MRVHPFPESRLTRRLAGDRLLLVGFLLMAYGLGRCASYFLPPLAQVVADAMGCVCSIVAALWFSWRVRRARRRDNDYMRDQMIRAADEHAARHGVSREPYQ